MSLRIAVFSEQLYHMDMAAVEILLGKEFRKITQVSEFNFTLSRSFCSQSLLFCPSGLLILSATRKDLVLHTHFAFARTIVYRDCISSQALAVCNT